MAALWLVLFALTSGVVQAFGENGTYVIVAPSKIRAGLDLAVSVNILKASQSVAVTASVLDTSMSAIASASADFIAGSPGTLNLKIPQTLSGYSYKLSVTGTGGLSFQDSATLGYTSKQFSLFIQSDKAIYKPGDTVNFRVFGAYSDLKPYTGPIDINIFDGSANKMKQWLQATPTDGVVTQSFQLSTQPTLGDWKISATASRTHSEKVFTVAEYVLPKFEVDVIMPSYVLSSDADVTFTVKAKYTYGQPVSGTADVAISFLRSYYSNYPERAKQITKITNVQIDGEAKVSIPMSTIKAVESYLNGHSLWATANVTETQTGRVMTANASVTVYSSGVKLDFPDSNPTTFKPGLQYTALLKVSQPDGLPVAANNDPLVISTSQTIRLPEPTVASGMTTTPRPFWYNPPSKTVNMPDVTISIPSNGLVAVPVTIDADAMSVNINAKLSGVSANLNLGKSHSPSNSYIQLSLKTKGAIKAGDVVDLEVISTQPQDQIVYQVLSRGSIVKTGAVSSQSQLVQPFSLTADESMSPDARIVVYSVRDDGEIVTDSISFNVAGVFTNKVSIQVNTTKTAPGDSVEVSVSADPSSVAHLMAIDQSVLLLKSGNDVTAEDVIEELKEYDTITSKSSHGGFGGCFNCRRKRAIWWDWPVFYGGNDAQQIFENSGVKVLTDCLVYHYDEPMIFIRGEFAFGAPMAGAGANSMDPNRAPQGGSVEKPSRVRTNFRETWLFLDSQIGANGSVSTTANIPDTITSWVISAFATNPNSGLGVAPTQAQVTVFKPFFVSLNLPYSVTRGEHLALQAIVFNYLQQDASVRVTLAKSSEFYNIMVDSSGQETWKSEDVYQDVMVKAGESKSVFFPILPAVLGRIDIKVSATTAVAGDALRRQLLVEAEGVPKEYSVPVLIDLTNGTGSFSQTIDLSLPGTTVQGSELVRVTAVGDLMGPSIDGLDSLLRMPTGCGEQTMLGLAPDVYITDYLKTVNQLTADIEAKALGFMESGYQRELTYKHDDGSFSAFGNRDDSGSMWLTAFVTRVFHEASSHVFVDDNVIKRAMDWMIRRQASNGSFPEPGRVIHKDMQGAAGQGIGLTCFVYISLLENQQLYTKDPANSPFNMAKAKALTYLESQVAATSDLYVLAMASYAFTLAGSSQTQAVLDRLEAQATKDGKLRYWHKAESAKPTSGSWHSPHSTRAVDTEMTAYVLQAYATQGNVVAGTALMQWLAQQRNPHGGFTSTQDTVVALSAMSKFASMTQTNDYNLQVTAKLDAAPTYTFNIDKTNALLQQVQETTTVPAKVKIDATGSGMALAQVSVFFNVESEVDDLTFDLTVTLIQETLNTMVIETCTSWLGEGDSSAMAVQEIGIPSGFSIDMEDITELSILKRVEAQNKKVVLYFDQIGKSQVCLTVRAERTGLVAKSQPAAVRVYDYYEPANQVTAFYQSQILKDSSVCDVCQECCA